MSNKVLIIGGGIIGLSLGWQLAKKGKEVEILERDKAGRSASWVSAGMLAPHSEMGFEEMELFELCRKSLELYPQFMQEVSKDSGIQVEPELNGCILPAFDRDEIERLRRIYEFREKVGLPIKWMSGTEAREIEPYLSPKCTGAIWIEEDGQVNNRKLLEALKAAFINCGGKLFEDHQVDEIIIKDGKIYGAQFHNINAEYDNIVIAAGAWSKQIKGIPENVIPPVRPVKGQIISLRMNDSCRLTKVVRAQDVYLLPKSDGRLIVGATNEEMGFDLNPTAGEVYRLLERGWETVPSIYDLPIDSIDVGLRPGSRDHEPIIGDCEIEGLYFATGHYRNGILLTPITAYELSDWMVSGNPSEILKPFQLSRFNSQLISN